MRDFGASIKADKSAVGAINRAPTKITPKDVEPLCANIDIVTSCMVRSIALQAFSVEGKVSSDAVM